VSKFIPFKIKAAKDTMSCSIKKGHIYTVVGLDNIADHRDVIERYNYNKYIIEKDEYGRKDWYYTDFFEFQMNKDQTKRDRYLNIKPEDYSGNLANLTKPYTGLNAKQLEWLINNNYANPEERQNDSPCIGEFLLFIKKHLGFMVQGYAIDISRPDYRISIDGLIGEETNIDEIIEFLKFNKKADELFFSNNHQHSWWD